MGDEGDFGADGVSANLAGLMQEADKALLVGDRDRAIRFIERILWILAHDAGELAAGDDDHLA